MNEQFAQRVQEMEDCLTSVAAGLAVLGVAGVGAVHARAQCRQRCRRLLGLLLPSLRALVVAVTLAQVVEAKVFDLVAALARHAALGALVALLLLLVFKAKELQLGLGLGLLGLCLRGSVPGEED